MKIKGIFCMLLAALCVLAPALSVSAAEVDSDAVYCFTAADFAADEQLTGICITGVPQSSTGTVMLGQRVLRSGDILTAEQVSRMTFHPLKTEENLEAQMSYLPIYEDRVEAMGTLSIAVIGKTDQAPVA